MDRFELTLPDGRVARFRRPTHGEWDQLGCVLMLEKWQRHNLELADACEPDQITDATRRLSGTCKALGAALVRALRATREDMALDVEAAFEIGGAVAKATKLIEAAVLYSQWVCPGPDLGNSPTPSGASSPAPEEDPAAPTCTLTASVEGSMPCGEDAPTAASQGIASMT